MQKNTSVSILSLLFQNNEIAVINEPDKKFKDLYLVKSTYDKKKQELISKHENTIKVRANEKKMSTKSQEINKEIRSSVFKTVFAVLDTESEGKIYGEKIKLDLLPPNLKKILEPLILELGDQNETLTDEEFLMACDHLYDVRDYLTLTLGDASCSKTNNIQLLL